MAGHAAHGRPRFAPPSAAAHPRATRSRVARCSMFNMHKKVSAKERIVGFYSTGPRIRPADLNIDSLFRWAAARNGRTVGRPGGAVANAGAPRVSALVVFVGGQCQGSSAALCRASMATLWRLAAPPPPHTLTPHALPSVRLRKYCHTPLLVIVDVRPDVQGLPVQAYASHDALNAAMEVSARARRAAAC